MMRDKQSLGRHQRRYKLKDIPPCTCVSIALVRVDWQIGQVGAGVLVRGPGHDEVHQAFGFTDGGDGFGVRHARHQLFIHLGRRRLELQPGREARCFTTHY